MPESRELQFHHAALWPGGWSLPEIVDSGPFIPTGTAILADLITDAVSVIPNHMSSSIRRHSNPGSIIKTIF